MRKNNIIIIIIGILTIIGISTYVIVQNKDDSDEHDNNVEKETTDEEKSTGQVNPNTNYVLVDTNQDKCYDNNSEITCPSDGENFFGQDAQYQGNNPSYKDNEDGTITDNNTGLMWQQDPGDKMSYSKTASRADSFELAGYNDWRLPTIKELYSLIDFSGEDINPQAETDSSDLNPFIDTDYINFEYGDTSTGDRIIDSQWATSSIYESTVMSNQQCFFGVNFADGRIKCYPTSNKEYFVIYVRGNESYGNNDFISNNNGTIIDESTGLSWQQTDSEKAMNWKESIDYCENLTLTDQDDWRLPNAKELQSLVDYSRSPDTTSSAAIDPIFETSSITNEAGNKDYPFYWSSTTHANMQGGGSAAYVSFGRALGYMSGSWIDVHGAGAQRSDPKIGSADNYPTGHGPQGDTIRVDNYVRCVRGGAEFVDVKNTVSSSSNNNSTTDTAPADSSNQNQLNSSGPPQEAITACNNKSEGSSCSFSTPDGTKTGNCKTIPEGDMACVPE